MGKGGRDNIDVDGSDDAGRDDDYCVGGIDDGGDISDEGEDDDGREDDDDGDDDDDYDSGDHHGQHPRRSLNVCGLLNSQSPSAIIIGYH